MSNNVNALGLGRNLKNHDIVHIVNAKNLCAIKSSNEKEKGYFKTIVDKIDISNTFVVTINSKDGGYVTFEDQKLLDKNPPDKYRYLGIRGENNALTLLDESFKDRIKFRFYTSRNDNRGTTYPILGQPYLLRTLAYPKTDIGITNDNKIQTKTFQINSESWIVVPEVRKSLGILPSCYYFTSYDYLHDSKCVDLERNLKECANKMNKFCSDPVNVFGEYQGCKEFLRENPNGVADQTILKICQNSKYEDRPECSCVAPIKYFKGDSVIRKQEFPRYWGCYGNQCQRNKTVAFKLSSQKNRECPGLAICYQQNIGDQGKYKLEFGTECKIGEPRDDNTSRDNIKDPPLRETTRNYLPIVLIVASIIAIMGLLIFLIRKR